MYRLRKICRACDSTELIPVFDLGLQPPANDFCGPDDEHAGHAPLKVLFCPKCTLAQLSVVVKPEILYSNYHYVTSKSATMQGHFDLLWQAINLECNPESVVEIGSNDGDFLAYSKNHGAEAVCGIDPAENLAKVANERGVHTFCGILDSKTANMAKASMPPVNLIIARHVFCHADDWHDFIKSLDIIANKDTLIVIEVPYVGDLLKNVEFDTIYHEHLSYLGIKPMTHLLDSTPFRLHKVVKFPIHGGSVAIMLRRRDHESKMNEGIKEYLNENITEKDWKDCKERAFMRLSSLEVEIFQLVKNKGMKVCGYGASAKASVWLNALGFTRKEIPFVCDSTPHKYHKFIPGTDIPVVGEIDIRHADYAICFAWNFRKEILEKNKLWLQKGGRFIFPTTS